MVETHDAWQSAVLRSLQLVGSAKPVGYQPLNTVANVLGFEVGSIFRDASARGLSAVCFDEERCCVKSGAIYLYDRVALDAILQDAASILMNHDIPSEPDDFIQYIPVNWLDENHPAHAVIVRTFGSPD